MAATPCSRLTGRPPSPARPITVSYPLTPTVPKGPSTPPRPLSADSRASRSAALTSAARPTRGSVALSFFQQVRILAALRPRRAFSPTPIADAGATPCIHWPATACVRQRLPRPHFAANAAVITEPTHAALTGRRRSSPDQTSDQGSDASHMMAIREHDLLTKEEELELAADVQVRMDGGSPHA